MNQMKKIISNTGKLFLATAILFSQLSFPLEVLADELMEETKANELEEIEQTPREEKTEEIIIPTQEEILIQEQTKTVSDVNSTDDDNTSKEQTGIYQVLVNGEETTDYTITDENKIIAITQNYTSDENYQFDNQTTQIDFTNKLYGTYKYIYSVSNESGVIDQKEITINYLGNNLDIINKYSSISTTIDNSFLLHVKQITAQELLALLNKNMIEQNLEANINIERNGLVLKENELIMTNDKIVLSNEQFKEEYNVIMPGDYNNDGIVNEEDAKQMIDGILNNEQSNSQNDVNLDGMFNIVDATSPIFTSNSWNNNIIQHDKLSLSLVNKEQIYIGEDVEVKLYINGFNQDILTGLEGILNYNKEILQLTNIKINSLYGNISSTGKFAYLINGYNSKNILISFTFKALKEGISNVEINNIIASIGIAAALDTDSMNTTISVLEFGKGGNDDTNTPTLNQTTTTSSIENSTTKTEIITTIPDTTSKITKTTVDKSSDNYLKELIIKNYDIDFDMYQYEYNLKVENSVKSLDISVKLNNALASYEIVGNEDFKVGENTVKINITAEDGTTRTYTLKVTRLDKEKKEVSKDNDEKEEEATNSTSKTIIIILIVLVIIGLIYIIFKDDQEDEE